MNAVVADGLRNSRGVGWEGSGQKGKLQDEALSRATYQLHGLSHQEDNVLLRNHPRIPQEEHGKGDVEQRQRADERVRRQDGHGWERKTTRYGGKGGRLLNSRRGWRNSCQCATLVSEESSSSATAIDGQATFPKQTRWAIDNASHAMHPGCRDYCSFMYSTSQLTLKLQ